MKTANDPRHQKRIDLMQKLFSYSFDEHQKHNDLAAILNAQTFIDQKIQHAAPEWPIDKIAKIDLAILRLATYELLISKREPHRVVIDEAIELAKSFGNDQSPKFVNGVLGTLVTELSAST